MLRTIFLLVLLVPAISQAQSCMPRSWFWPTDRATAEVVVNEPTGTRRWWWCQKADDTWQLTTQASLSGVESPETRLHVAELVRLAKDPDAGVNQAFDLLSNYPDAGTQRDYDLKLLRYHACEDGAANPPPGAGQVTNRCVKPTPPGAPAFVVGPATRTDGTRPAYHFSGSTRGTEVKAGAKAGDPCGDMIFLVTSAGSWRTFGPSFVADVGTLCVKAP